MNYRDTVDRLDSRLRIGTSFDIIKRDITVGGRTGTLYCIDGFTKDEVVFKMLLFLTGLKPEQIKGITAASEFVARYVTYTEAETTTDLDRGGRSSGLMISLSAFITGGNIRAQSFFTGTRSRIFRSASCLVIT